MKTDDEGRFEITIRYGSCPTPFGDCFIAATDRGICALSFPDDHGIAEALEELRHRWKKATLTEETRLAKELAERIFDRSRKGNTPLPDVDAGGTAFQAKVWEALVRIPPGRTASYEEIAARIGHPKAVRAVGNAVARNPVAVLIPCHRVIPKSGGIGNYRWGTERKRALLAWEAAGAR